MDKNSRFDLVFAKLGAALEEQGEGAAEKGSIRVFPLLEPSHEELDEIDQLRRIVVEVTEPVSMSFTTT